MLEQRINANSDHFHVGPTLVQRVYPNYVGPTSEQCHCANSYISAIGPILVQCNPANCDLYPTIQSYANIGRCKLAIWIEVVNKFL